MQAPPLTARKEAARRFLTDIWSRGDLEAADALLAPDFVFLLSVPPFRFEGPELFKQLVARNRHAFEGLTYTPDDEHTVAEGDQVVVPWTMRARHVGEWAGYPASHKDVSIRGMTHYRFEGDKIAAAQVQNDALGLVRQIGGLPPVARLPYHLEPLFACTWTVTEEVIGLCPQGLRVNAYVTGGEVSGPRLRGTVRPVDGNWATLLSNGVVHPDYRLTFQTDDGALVGVTATGVGDFGEDAHQKAARGEALERLRPLRLGVHFHTAHPDYLWLNRVLGLGICQYDSQQHAFSLDAYAVH